MPWPDEVDLNELYRESGQLVGVRFVPPDDIDAVYVVFLVTLLEMNTAS